MAQAVIQAITEYCKVFGNNRTFEWLMAKTIDMMKTIFSCRRSRPAIGNQSRAGTKSEVS